MVAGAVWLVYWRALNSPFIFDDSGSVADNLSIVKLWPLIGDSEHHGPLNPRADLPTSGRPLVNLSLAVNYSFGHRNPVGYHVFNLIVHVLSAFLLMAIVRRTLCLDYFAGRFVQSSAPLAFFVALLWALHPLQTETVVYVTQRTELMVGFFYLATLYCSLRYWAADSGAGRNTWLALAITACLAGMACKEVMVSAPVIVLLFERTFIRGSLRRAMQKSWPLYVGLFLSWGLLLYLNYNAPCAESAGFHLGLPAYTWWLTQTKVLLLYLKLTVWPSPLSIHYEMPYLETLGAAWPWLAPVILLTVATLILLWRRSAAGFVGALGAIDTVADIGRAHRHRIGGRKANVSAIGRASHTVCGGQLLAGAANGAAVGACRCETPIISAGNVGRRGRNLRSAASRRRECSSTSGV